MHAESISVFGGCRAVMKEERSPIQRAVVDAGGEPAALSGELLERVIQETLASGAEIACADFWPGLLEVARRFLGEKLVVDPVLIALVKAILGPQFQRGLRDGAAWDEIARCIATTLFEDAVARDRVNALWARIQEVSLE
jgi:hypothetical protein